jgi:ribosomal protein S18 acetylase RimI-like enzyme
MSQASIRHPLERDIDVLVEIYITCFPDRVREVFGGAHHRLFISDYLRFYLAWDPAHTWVYADGNEILGIVVSPCRYSPTRTALHRGQAFTWLWHLLSGRYGLPLHIVNLFLRSGFVFNRDPAIKRLWGKPYIHLFAVTEGSQGRGIGSQLMRWTLDQFEREGIDFCWLMVQRGNLRGVNFYMRFGFWTYKSTADGDTIMVWGNTLSLPA